MWQPMSEHIYLLYRAEVILPQPQMRARTTTMSFEQGSWARAQRAYATVTSSHGD